MNSCAIIIPTFNRAALLKRCLESVAGTRPPDIELELIVVDDGSAEPLGDLGDGVRLVRLEENQGFATACNAGAEVATSDWLLFLNNDMVPRPSWLAELVRYTREWPRAAVVGSKLLYPDGTVQHAGVVICQDRYPRHLYKGFPGDHPAVSRSRRFQVVTAACLVVRRGLFLEQGGFDQAFRNGFEDVDFCLRLAAQGHEVHYCATSVLEHLESVSEGRFAADGQNTRLYRERWFDSVRPDDLDYYLADGLLQIDYEGRYPARWRVSPLLAAIDTEAGEGSGAAWLEERLQRAEQLQRENTQLRIQLGEAQPDAPALRYAAMRERLGEIIQQAVPADAAMAVVSKGDSSLLSLGGRRGCHFPQTPRGSYLGHHPANSEEALAQLHKVQQRGADYLVFPQTANWWLDHYVEFCEWLNEHGERVWSDQTCVIYRLTNREPEGTVRGNKS